ncbi:MAG TPA: hypothetical protein VE967_18475 [Gemmatimonadaceae bacterium]|nr:hypothetical protein [Gemmatimonadaceae bacterium]
MRDFQSVARASATALSVLLVVSGSVVLIFGVVKSTGAWRPLVNGTITIAAGVVLFRAARYGRGPGWLARLFEL